MNAPHRWVRSCVVSSMNSEYVQPEISDDNNNNNNNQLDIPIENVICHIVSLRCFVRRSWCHITVLQCQNVQVNEMCNCDAFFTFDCSMEWVTDVHICVRCVFVANVCEGKNKLKSTAMCDCNRIRIVSHVQWSRKFVCVLSFFLHFKRFFCFFRSFRIFFFLDNLEYVYVYASSMMMTRGNR